MNPSITCVALEAAGLRVNAPDTELTAIKGELKALVALFEGRFTLPPLGE
jgi:hypothetical protein